MPPCHSLSLVGPLTLYRQKSTGTQSCGKYHPMHLHSRPTPLGRLQKMWLLETKNHWQRNPWMVKSQTSPTQHSTKPFKKGNYMSRMSMLQPCSATLNSQQIAFLLYLHSLLTTTSEPESAPVKVIKYWPTGTETAIGCSSERVSRSFIYTSRNVQLWGLLRIWNYVDRTINTL